MTWSVPREWEGGPAFILGGGASLTGFDASILRGKGRIIAIKEAGLTMAPGADVLYWADKWWLEGRPGFEGNLSRLRLHKGKYKVCRFEPKDSGGHDIKVLPQDKKVALSTDPTKLAGLDAGAACINLAYLFGASSIVLLGFDMQGGNWDGRPRKAETNDRYRKRFMPMIEKMAGPLRAAGVDILNATPDSALDCFPKVPLAEILGA